MNSVKKLMEVCAKNKRLVIGLMSGTSCDGLDVVLCELYSNLQQKNTIHILNYATVAYNKKFKISITEILAKSNVPLNTLCELNVVIAREFATIVLDCLERWSVKPHQVDIIASHGQTLYHISEKEKKYTFQIGDGDHLAYLTGIICVSDFRQKNIAGGGLGAPLAPYADFQLFKSHIENRVMVNIGGISNFTFIPKNADFVEVSCCDTGPGNGIMDAFIHSKYPDLYFDKGGELASSSNPDSLLIDAMMAHPYFSADLPKSTGKEVFNLGFLERSIQNCDCGELTNSVIMATLNFVTAKTLSNAIQKQVLDKEYTIYIDGGGRKNKTLMKNISSILNKKINIGNPLNIPSDIKEALIFVVLANDCLSLEDENLGSAHPYLPKVRMGKISLPN